MTDLSKELKELQRQKTDLEIRRHQQQPQPKPQPQPPPPTDTGRPKWCWRLALSGLPWSKDFVRVGIGIPTVVVTSHESSTEKKTLNPREATKNRLLVAIVNGKFFWTSRNNQPLQLHHGSGSDFTYLYYAPGGAYIKFTTWGNKIIYMEHANILLSTKTYWGEMKIISSE